MKRAQRRDAVLNEKFDFRPKLASCETPVDATHCTADFDPSVETTNMSVNEIING